MIPLTMAPLSNIQAQEQAQSISSSKLKTAAKGLASPLFLVGIGFTFLLALLGYALALIPGVQRIGPMACAIVLAVAYRQFLGYPQALASGIQFSSKYLLRLAIILFGLKLNISVIAQQGAGMLLRDAGVVIFSILATVWIGRKLKADAPLTLLLGIGTGVCGAAAIAAVSPILKSKEQDTAAGAGLIALVGTIFAVTYTLLLPLLPMGSTQYGMWAGLSLHELAHVALAGAPAGQDALAQALLAKLGRVFLLVPLSFVLMYWMKRSGKAEPGTRIQFPWFLLGFLGMSLLGSFVLGRAVVVPDSVMNAVSVITTFLLTAAMVGLGLNVDLAQLRTKAVRPLLAMMVTSVLLSMLTWLSV
ncbi:YeiH family protein [Paenibacillus sp. J22TS3]|uniref:YeiH family protein n=1 Tax=Paenibacillus sp. J22TS3 TaxID=2807192 RepID=UPI001B24FBC7|nr:putative sulfate exporter family transporter [Paenibacillus sp. J22TS3]GIP21964.1 membrane protein [Paenibacillus sp. J22TS3]